MMPTRDAVHAELRALAQAVRKPEETSQQAYARAIAQTALGKSLFGLYQALPPAEATPSGTTRSSAIVTGGHSALQARGAEIRKREPKLTQAQAFAKAYCDPANRPLVEDHNRERRGLPRAVA